MFTPNDVFETQILTTEDIVTVVEEHNYTLIEEEVDIDDDYIPPTETPPCNVYHYEIGLNTDLKYTSCTGNEITLSLSGGNKGDICVQRGTTPQIITPDPTNTVTPTGD